MKIKELRAKSISELNQIVIANRVAVRDLRFKDTNKQVKNVKEIQTKKKEIARILTLVAQKAKEANQVQK